MSTNTDPRVKEARRSLRHLERMQQAGKAVDPQRFIEARANLQAVERNAARVAVEL